MEKLDQALKFAIEAHKNQTRKLSDSPYIVHPMEVGAIVARITNDEDTICAAVLHDVVEDTEKTVEDIRERFGDRVAELVSHETENKYRDLPAALTWQRRKEETLKNLKESKDISVKIMWLGDKLSNVRSLLTDYERLGDGVWQFFHEKDKNKQSWYYYSVAEAIREDLKDTDSFREYEYILGKIFGEKK